MRLLLAFCILALPASAQWRLYLIAGGTERPVQDTCDIGATEAGGEIVAVFRLRNTGTAAAAPGAVTVAGAHFLPIEGAPPAAVAAGGLFDFAVRFEPRAAGAFSAALEGPHGSTILRASAAPALIVRSTSGVVLERGASLDFGNVETGLAEARRVLIENRTAGALPVPAVSAAGPDFTLRGELPPALDPAQSAYLEVIFTPLASGERLGALSIGSRRIPLRGFGTEPPLPGVTLLAAGAVRSAEQHVVRVRFEAPLRGAAWGELAIAGGGADDTLVFANGTKSVAFQALPGERERSFAYQTGATAGPIRFLLRFGERLEETVVHIAEEPVRVTGAHGNRDEGGVALRLTALDNTLTTSLLTYTFFDRAGKEIGRWSQDYAESFFNHFKGSRMGGAYSLFIRFPVIGDVTQVDSVRVELTNAAGVTVTDRIAF